MNRLFFVVAIVLFVLYGLFALGLGAVDGETQRAFLGFGLASLATGHAL